MYTREIKYHGKKFESQKFDKHDQQQHVQLM